MNPLPDLLDPADPMDLGHGVQFSTTWSRAGSQDDDSSEQTLK